MVLDKSRFLKSRLLLKYEIKHKTINASATLEASLVIPIYVFAVMSLMFMIRIAGIRNEVQKALADTVSDMSAYAYNPLSDEPLVSSAAAYAYFISDIGTDYADNNFIEGGNAGFFLTSEGGTDKDSNMTVTLRYAVKNPFNIFGFGTIRMMCSMQAQAWLGDKYQKEIEDAKTEMVYVTQYGKVYHKSRECNYLNLKISRVMFSDLSELRNLDGEIYKKCEKCGNENDSKASYVYVTQYGNKYHTDIKCSGLNRSVFKIPINDVENRTPCSKCFGK